MPLAAESSLSLAILLFPATPPPRRPPRPTGDLLPSDRGPSRARLTSWAYGPSLLFPFLLPTDPACPRSIFLSRAPHAPFLRTDSSVFFLNMASSSQRAVEISVSLSTSADRPSPSRWRAESLFRFWRFIGYDVEAKNYTYSLEDGGINRKITWQGILRSIRDSHRKVRDSYDELIMQRNMAMCFSGGDRKELKLRVTGRIWKEQ